MDGIAENIGFYAGYTVVLSNSKYKVLYFHLDPTGTNNILEKGEKRTVKMGDVIGLADNTGFSTGSHLHYEIHKIENGKERYATKAEMNALWPPPF